MLEDGISFLGPAYFQGLLLLVSESVQNVHYWAITKFHPLNILQPVLLDDFHQGNLLDQKAMCTRRPLKIQFLSFHFGTLEMRGSKKGGRESVFSIPRCFQMLNGNIYIYISIEMWLPLSYFLWLRKGTQNLKKPWFSLLLAQNYVFFRVWPNPTQNRDPDRIFNIPSTPPKTNMEHHGTPKSMAF